MQPDIAHTCCDQLTAVKTGYPLTSITWPYRGPRYRPSKVDFFKFSADKLLVCKWSQAQVHFFRCFGNTLCLLAALLKLWFPTDFTIKILLLFVAYLFIELLVVKCAACQSYRKSDFGCHRFQNSPCLMRKRVKKSQEIVAFLDGFRELRLHW